MIGHPLIFSALRRTGVPKKGTPVLLIFLIISYFRITPKTSAAQQHGGKHPTNHKKIPQEQRSGFGFFANVPKMLQDTTEGQSTALR